MQTIPRMDRISWVEREKPLRDYHRVNLSAEETKKLREHAHNIDDDVMLEIREIPLSFPESGILDWSIIERYPVRRILRGEMEGGRPPGNGKR